MVQSIQPEVGSGIDDQPRRPRFTRGTQIFTPPPLDFGSLSTEAPMPAWVLEPWDPLPSDPLPWDRWETLQVHPQDERPDEWGVFGNAVDLFSHDEFDMPAPA